MRYYNQNPQVTALLEKIEEQEKVIKELQKELLFKVVLAEKLRSELRDFTREFNSLPWHKKMFYKFKDIKTWEQASQT